MGMPRIGTLLDIFCRPEGRVEIIHKSKKATRIRRSTGQDRSWSLAEESVPTEFKCARCVTV